MVSVAAMVLHGSSFLSSSFSSAVVAVIATAAAVMIAVANFSKKGAEQVYPAPPSAIENFLFMLLMNAIIINDFVIISNIGNYAILLTCYKNRSIGYTSNSAQGTLIS